MSDNENRPTPDWIKGAIGWIMIIIVGTIIYHFEKKDKSSDKIAKNTTEQTLPKMTEDEYVKYFQAKWDSVKLYNENGFPKYETYVKDLNATLDTMVLALVADTSRKLDLKTSPLKLNKLRLKFIDSKRYKNALQNYYTYGQPYSGNDLKGVCEDFLEANANDPSSIDIDDYEVQGKSKNGWVVIVKFRGKNAFGGVVVNESRFDVRFNPLAKMFYVKSSY